MILIFTSFSAVTFAESNGAYRYHVRKKQSLGTILNRLGACPLWGKNGNVEYITRLNSEKIKDPANIEVDLVIEIPKNVLVYKPHPFFLELENDEIIENPKFLKEEPCKKRYAVARDRAPTEPIAAVVNPAGEEVRAKKAEVARAKAEALQAQTELEIQQKIAADLERKKKLAEAHEAERAKLLKKKQELELAREQEKARALELQKELELKQERERLEAIERKKQIQEAKELTRQQALERQKELDAEIKRTRFEAAERKKELELNKELERHARLEEKRARLEAEVARREQERAEAVRVAKQAAERREQERARERDESTRIAAEKARAVQEAAAEKARLAQQAAAREAEEEARANEARLAEEKAAREAAERVREKVLEQQRAAALEKARVEASRVEQERAEAARLAEQAAERKQKEAALKREAAETKAAREAELALEKEPLSGETSQSSSRKKQFAEDEITEDEKLADKPLVHESLANEEAPLRIPPRVRPVTTKVKTVKPSEISRAPAQAENLEGLLPSVPMRKFTTLAEKNFEIDDRPDRIPARNSRRTPVLQKSVRTRDLELQNLDDERERPSADAAFRTKTTQREDDNNRVGNTHNNIDNEGKEIERVTASLNEPETNESSAAVKKDAPPVASIDDTLNFSILPNFGLINGVDLATNGTASLASELEYKFQLTWKVKGWARNWFYEGTFETQQRKFIQPVDITITQAVAQYSKLHLVVGNNLTRFLGINASFGAEQLPSFITENTGDIRLDRVFMPQVGLGVELRPFQFDNINAGIRAQYFYHGPTMGFELIHQGGNTQTYSVWVERYYDTIGILGRIAYTRAKYQGDYASHDLLDVNAGLGISIRLDKIK